MTRKESKNKTSKKTPEVSSNTLLPKQPNNEVVLPGYDGFLESLKKQIQTAQLRAATAVNVHATELYFNIGKAIVDRQEQAGWGDAVLKELSKDLASAFPEMKGFSERNLYRMRTFYLAYRAESDISATAVAKIPWGHNIVIIDKVKDPQERAWYVGKTLENGWSRSILKMQIDTELYNRQGHAITNFSKTLPTLQSDLAQQVLKDPYNFDFLTLDEQAHERDIEKSLVKHIEKFLLELGVGFAFVGKQYHMDIGEKDFYIDLLFYHLRLRCYVVIELKGGDFKPEYAGQLNFYLSAVDDLLRHPDDKPSIGLLLCRTKNQFVAEYALRGISKPIGVSEFTLTESLPDNLKGQLPTIEELEKELGDLSIESET